MTSRDALPCAAQLGGPRGAGPPRRHPRSRRAPGGAAVAAAGAADPPGPARRRPGAVARGRRRDRPGGGGARAPYGERAPGWFPDWSGETVFLLASGPSLAQAPLEELRGRGVRLIAINRSWERAPWADALYGCDFAFWNHYRGCPGFTGIKASQDKLVLRRPWGVHHVVCERRSDTLVLDRAGVIGWGGNSGFHALNLAVLWGARRIGLVGYDMSLAAGLHWHGAHPKGLNNPTINNVARWRRVVDEAAPVLAGLGIEVLNCAPGSALEAYPKCTLHDAIGAWCR